MRLLKYYEHKESFESSSLTGALQVQDALRTLIRSPEKAMHMRYG